MPLPPPSPDDSQESLYRQARLLYEKHEEKKAVIERIRQYIEPWRADKRMRIMGQIMLREIDQIEKEEAEKTQREGRGL